MITSSLSFTTPAQASGSLLQNLVDFSKDKLTGVKSITIYNEIGDQVKQEKRDLPKKETKHKETPDNPDMDEIEKAAEFASQKTGVRKDFLMGMLVVESNLGQNTGQCTYKEVADGAEQAYETGRLSAHSWELFQQRSQIIKDIAAELHYNADELKVSCNPAYTGTGGAMGIPQFMPDTWLEYKDRISAVLGKDTPDPWEIQDGVLAMALKLADVAGVVDHNRWAERAAAKLYLSGTTSWRYEWYANQIAYWSENYKKILG